MGLLQRLFGNHSRGGHHGGGTYRAAAVAAVCPGCRASIAASSRFCPQCGGAVLPQACRNCNASHPAGARFCGQCGQPTT
ncbi:zinc ribbon domain-containing protein [Delftia sp. ASV31]|uniref:zinc ribbon domain-containing protein n=1 Tax=Delftia sp. ASV31 TaxID=2795113 RepID=UPI0018EC94ED|nr:zinc ribbon domain-containing protein [Delftia sp. ASV31]